jgi:putative hydrolases of HD superfamily
MDERLKKQIDFIVEIDKVKAIIRKTKLFNGSRAENDAEHSWHLALMALTLAEYSNKPVDVCKIIKMVLIHDIVEIDAGDVMIYMKTGADLENEEKAAERIFGILPDDQRTEFIELWKEFEAKESDEATFAAALDRLEPVMQNYMTDASTWQKAGISAERIYEINEHIRNGSERIWEYAKSLIDECVDRGLISRSVDR